MSMFGDNTPMEEIWDTVKHVQRMAEATPGQMVTMLSYILATYVEYEVYGDTTDAHGVNAELTAAWQKR